MNKKFALLGLLSIFGFNPVVTFAGNVQQVRSMDELHTLACNKAVRSEGPWRINNLGSR